MEQPVDLATLRRLMAQHRLRTADLPEIGSKSMVSRVLSGERGLNKNHIRGLSRRFGIYRGSSSDADPQIYNKVISEPPDPD